MNAVTEIPALSNALLGRVCIRADVADELRVDGTRGVEAHCCFHVVVLEHVVDA